ncbi:MAG: hypothetical protein EB121_05275, partial [Alphaproteobacteria bacterium]|nr:hypothetical protein [Alphaproteobacteria bacterium]
MVGMEVIMPGAMFLWIGIAAGFTSLVVLLFPGMHWLAQSVLFGVAAVVSVVVSTRYFPAKEVTSDDPNLNNRMQRHVGHIGVVETAIIPSTWREMGVG